jgi:hypothetical protein
MQLTSKYIENYRHLKPLCKISDYKKDRNALKLFWKYAISTALMDAMLHRNKYTSYSRFYVLINRDRIISNQAFTFKTLFAKILTKAKLTDEEESQFIHIVEMTSTPQIKV